MNCPVCGATTEPAVRDMIRCTACTLYIKPVSPSLATLKVQLKNWSLSAIHVPRRWILRVGSATEQFSWVYFHLDRPPGRMFDVGASGGFIMNAAEHLGWEVEGNELSVVSIDWGKEKFGYHIRYGDITELTMPQGYYDLFVLWHSLEHMKDLNQALSTMSAALKPDGCVALAVPFRNALTEKQYEAAHFYEFSMQALDTLFAKYGFTRTHHRLLNQDSHIHAQVNVIFKKE